ncbi:MAG: cell division protein FtsZ [Rickettsiales bacterium]|nr:cell division protein FtsZ [Rickettsiales bacterium]
MVLNLQVPEKINLKPTITVIGVGGAGGNAVNNMIDSGVEGVRFVVANTDAQAIENSKAVDKIQLGTNVTQGLGAGSYPEVGKAAAEESIEEILDFMQGSNMVFVTAGMGGGTGTGAAPVIARLAREQGILTVGVVTKPFHFEGTHRMRVAELGLQELQKYVDTMIVIPNQNLFRVADKNTTLKQAFNLADSVLKSGVRGITDLMIMPGLVNLDFSDVRAVMSEMGKAMMGTGEAEGENRAIKAAEAAIANPLLDNVSMQGARGVLINITGGPDLTLFEVDEAANRIREEVDENANIIFGSTSDNNLEGKIRVSVVATGIDGDSQKQKFNNSSFAPKSQTRPEIVSNSAFESPKRKEVVEDFREDNDVFISKEPINPEFSQPQNSSNSSSFTRNQENLNRGNIQQKPVQSSSGLFSSIFSRTPKQNDRQAPFALVPEEIEPKAEANVQSKKSQIDEDVIDIPAYLRRKG